MDLRLGTIEDYDIFNEMYVNFFFEDLVPHKQSPVSIERYQKLLEYEAIYFAVENGKEIGFTVVYGYVNEGAKIELFYVKEKNKGFGTEFYRLIEKEVRESGLNRMKRNGSGSDRVSNP